MISSRANSKGSAKGSLVFALLALVGIACAVLFAIESDVFSFKSTKFAQKVEIGPEGAIREGAQWRVITQWQDTGNAQSEFLQLVEFKPVPGWATPAPVAVRKGETRTEIKGVYQPVEYSEEVILRLAGATTLSNCLAPELAENYLVRLGANEVRKVPGKDDRDIGVQGIFYSSREIRTIEISGGGTPSGFSELSKGTCDLAMAANRPLPAEVALFPEDIVSPETEFMVGMDAVAIVVHRDNPVQTLTIDDVGKIFRGEITSWNQIGGPSAPIKIFALRDNFGARGVVQNIFMEGQPYGAAVRDVDVHSMMSDFISADPHAIGFCSVAFAQQCRVVGIKTDAEAEAVFPTPSSIRTHAYPAFRSLYFYQLSETKNVYARDFLRMTQSLQGQELVEYCGFVNVENASFSSGQEITVGSATTTVPQVEEQSAVATTTVDADKIIKEEAVPGNASEKKDAKAQSLPALNQASMGALPPLEQIDGEVVPDATRQKVLKAYREAVSGASQLPMVLRFELSGTTLDQSSQKVLGDLIRELKSPSNAGKKVILVGFSDSVGSYATNLIISQQRADTVAKTLKGKGISNVVALAAGEEDPMKPNKTRNGRIANRRVQVWVK